MTDEENQTVEEEAGARKKMSKKRFLWIGLVIVLIAVFFILSKDRKNTSTISKDESEIAPQFIQADFVDLSRIYSISKFRSGSGHDFSNGTEETCRSMKHYFNVAWTEEGERQRRKNNEMPPAPDGKNDIKIFSPVDGKITSIQSEQKPIGEQIYIRPDNYPGYTIRLFHIYKLDNIKDGSSLKAGQQIGVIGQYQNTDIAIESRSVFATEFFSYFEVMSDSVFEKYKARGVNDKSELIITKEYRDANPLKCNGEQFAENYDQTEPEKHFIYLSGYTDPNTNR